MTIPLGLVVGSFLNVCIWRIPRDESLVFPGSHCPQCNAPVKWSDNIPIISFLLLAGRCRRCKTPIPWRYPLVEGLTAGLYFTTVLHFGIATRTVFLLLFLSVLVVITFIDLDHGIIPHILSLPGIPIGLVASLLTFDPPPFEAATGALVGAGLVYLVAVYAEVAFQQESMGGGDVNLLSMIGAFLGWRLMLVSFGVAVIAGACLSLALIASRVLSRKDRIPFGPFLALGAVVALFVGDEVIDWYLGLFG
ncbi:Type 4 prepilin-like proteins leader peptide processing enzyme [Candidatus Methylomirabilis oxygeniifera]|uniref:Prepilin leader peptidase/N-methyltransferase n=1 Tax=Methylomirabilis oxygeniifera TaxID=671143 RepID=D5MMF2_METO1|nr:Type 4 prepilin-like proteins leader peptide processing enzyme [Candidatus Methylomirabilis oxyfera]